MTRREFPIAPLRMPASAAEAAGLVRKKQPATCVVQRSAPPSPSLC